MSTYMDVVRIWMVGEDMKSMVKLYRWCLKASPGVRRSTCTGVCYAESGCVPLKDIVGLKQNSFFRSM